MEKQQSQYLSHSEENGCTLESEQEEALRLEREDFTRQLATIHGRRFLWNLMTESGIFRSSFDSDPVKMAFNEGYRNMGLSILARLEQDLTAFQKMIEEENERRKKT